MGGVTVRVERRFLLWMAPRLPRRINSDHLTVLALAAMALAGAGYWLAATTAWGLWVVNAGLVINWFGDSLDGTLARVRQRQRPRYGHYVDHVVDAAGAALLIGGMALSGYVTPMLALGVIAAYFLVNIEIHLGTHSLGIFRMSMAGIGGTELRLILIAINSATALAHPASTFVLAGQTLRLFDPAAAFVIAGLLAAFVVSTVRNTRTLYEAERLPRV
jgi:phosphatidylglycerophosphate synthase